MTNLYISASSAHKDKTTLAIMFGLHLAKKEGGFFKVISEDTNGASYQLAVELNGGDRTNVYASEVGGGQGDLGIGSVLMMQEIKAEGTYVFDLDAHKGDLCKIIKQYESIQGKCKNIILTHNISPTAAFIGRVASVNKDEVVYHSYEHLFNVPDDINVF